LSEGRSPAQGDFLRDPTAFRRTNLCAKVKAGQCTAGAGSLLFALHGELKFARCIVGSKDALSAQREADMAVNKPVGDNARKGAVKKRTQLKNPLTKTSTKRNRRGGRFMEVKKAATKFKGVRREK
jgi:hypothetical protein